LAKINILILIFRYIHVAVVVFLKLDLVALIVDDYHLIETVQAAILLITHEGCLAICYQTYVLAYALLHLEGFMIVNIAIIRVSIRFF